MNFNPLTAVADALKVWPEEVSYPERLEGASPVELAEARSRLQQIGQAANELRRLVDRQLAVDLDGGTLRYGDSVIRVSGRGSAKVVDRDAWWRAVAQGVEMSENPTALLGALYPADSVRLTAIPALAAVLEVDPDAFKTTMIDYAPPTSPLSVMPISKAKWAQDLEEGEVVHRGRREEEG